MVELGFDKGLGAGDVDAVLADELCARDVIRAEGFSDKRYRPGRAVICGLDGDLV